MKNTKRHLRIEGWLEEAKQNDDNINNMLQATHPCTEESVASKLPRWREV